MSETDSDVVLDDFGDGCLYRLGAVCAMFLRSIRDLGRRWLDDSERSEEDAADHGDSDGTPESLHRADDAARGTGLLGIYRRDDELGIRRDEQSASHTGDEQWSEQVPVGKVGSRHQQQHEPDRDESDGEHPYTDDQHFTAENRCESTALRRPEDAADRERDRHEARLERRVPETGLPEDRDREEDARERGEVDQGEDCAAGERRVRIEVRRNQRTLPALGVGNLPKGEEHNQNHAARDEQVSPERPTDRLSLNQRNQDRDQAAREKHKANPVDATGWPAAPGALRQQQDRCHQRDDADRHIYVEHVAPALLLAERLDE